MALDLLSTEVEGSAIVSASVFKKEGSMCRVFFKMVERIALGAMLTLLWVGVSSGIDFQAAQADYPGFVMAAKAAILLVNFAVLYMAYHFITGKHDSAATVVDRVTHQASYPCCDLDVINQKRKKGIFRLFPIFRSKGKKHVCAHKGASSV